MHVLETESTQHDILMLTETWMLPEMQAPAILGHTCFSSPRAFKNAQARRASGGVACYVKDAIASRCELWRVSLPGSIMWLRSKEKYMQRTGEHHLYLGLIYIPPKGSSFNRTAMHLLPMTSCSNILQTCLQMMAWQSFEISKISTPALAQLVVFANMTSVMFFMPLVSRDQDQTKYRCGKGFAWQQEELNSVKPCAQLGPAMCS